MIAFVSCLEFSGLQLELPPLLSAINSFRGSSVIPSIGIDYSASEKTANEKTARETGHFNL